MSTFLLEYDPAAGRLVRLDRYPIDERERAQAARLEREKANARAHVRREVVLLEAESEDALRVTHGRYFKSLGELAEVL